MQSPFLLIIIIIIVIIIIIEASDLEAYDSLEVANTTFYYLSTTSNFQALLTSRTSSLHYYCWNIVLMVPLFSRMSLQNYSKWHQINPT